jgi:very-short-patch-repair endonuclease
MLRPPVLLPAEGAVGRTRMADRDNLLVAIMPNLLDFALARDKHWYRIPVAKADRWMRGRWPPVWLAWYFPKVFGAERYSISTYARVESIRITTRLDLFPDAPSHPRAMEPYYQLRLGPLQRRTTPIVSRRLRRVTFIPTTWRKFVTADEINDLFDDSPLEDRLWSALKQCGVPADRQTPLRIKSRTYLLDFAVDCHRGPLAIETDGDTWHANRARIPLDNQRDNDLETAGWSLLRFNSHHINEQMVDYCLPAITEKINKLGGLDEGGLLGRRLPAHPDQPRQLGLFESVS